MASYVDRERRMLNLVIALVCCYVTCWLPYHATRIFMFFAPPSWYACNQTVFGKIKKVAFLMQTGVGDKIIMSLTSTCHQKQTSNHVPPIVVQFVFQSMAQISSCLDPLLFAFVSSEFRQDVKGILSFKCDKENNSNFNYSLSEAFADQKPKDDAPSHKLGKIMGFRAHPTT